MTGTNKKMNFPIMKGIKISEEQAKNWDVQLIRNALDGDSNEDELKGCLKVYNYLFEKITGNFKIFEFIQKTDESLIEYIENHEEFDKVLELIN